MGGANIATFNQIERLMHSKALDISIFSQTSPPKSLIDRLTDVTFHRAPTGKSIIDEKLVSMGLKEVLKSSEFSLLHKCKKFTMSIYAKLYGQEKAFQKYQADADFTDYLNQILANHDVACVPFENSVYRALLAESKCSRKVQWIHTDYAFWRNLNETTRDISSNDHRLYKSMDVIVFVSNKSLDGFVELYPELNSKCVVCGNLFDVDQIKKMACEPFSVSDIKFDNSPQKFKIITVARLADFEKNIKRSIDVAAMLKKDGFDFEWMFVGDGYDREMLHSYASSLQLNDYILWAGHQDNPYKFLKTADVFALFSNYEGIPNTIYESLIVGTPVIASNIGGIPEQVTDATGWLVNNDIGEIYTELVFLISNRDLVIKLKKRLQSYEYDNDLIDLKYKVIFEF